MKTNWAVIVLGLALAAVLGSVTTEPRRRASLEGMPGVIGPRPLAAGETTAFDPIASALSAAPAEIARVSRVVTLDAGGRPRVLRDGSGAFTCIPDEPATPGDDAICVDAEALTWVRAWRTASTPRPGRLGLGWMLGGGLETGGPSVHAPCAGAPPGPHLMVISAAGLEGYPASPNPDGHPYVMGAGTPWAHLMVPDVASRGPGR